MVKYSDIVFLNFQYTWSNVCPFNLFCPWQGFRRQVYRTSMYDCFCVEPKTFTNREYLEADKNRNGLSLLNTVDNPIIRTSNATSVPTLKKSYIRCALPWWEVTFFALKWNYSHFFNLLYPKVHSSIFQSLCYSQHC